jgi:outer membrane DcaP-like protein
MWRRKVSKRRIAAALVIVALFAAALAHAAAPPKKSAKPAGPSLSQRVATQKKQIDAQQATIDAQRALIDTLRADADSQTVRVGAQQVRLAELEAQLAEMKKRMETLESQASFPAWEDSLEARIRKVEAATKKSPELPPDIVSAGDFPGSIRIPGSDAAIKFGGRIRTSVVLTLDPLGTDDRFLTNSIPVGQPQTGEAKRTNISARTSRINIEFRTPGGIEELRAFFEGDFAGTVGSTNAFRLRHAYAQYRGVIAGQTWSTFSDPLVDVEDLDFEGISSENVIRQPLIRYWWSPKPNTRLAVAAETPSVSISGGTGVNLFPDVIARGFFGRDEGQHIQIAGVVRQIRAESASGVRSEWGAGATVSGIKNFKIRGLTDYIRFQVNGGYGIARYINDLNSLGGQDAVFDTTGELKPLPALGWYVAYEHHWKEWKAAQNQNLRSTLLWSWVTVDNFDFQPPNAYDRTNRFAANLVYSPTGRADLGLQYIYGTRTNKDGQHADANQFQVVAVFRF